MLRVDVFNIENFDESRFDSFMKLLPELEQLKINRYRNLDDRIRSLVARLLLIDAYMVNGDFSKFEIKRDTHNKPFVPDWGVFNISHSGNFVTIAYSNKLYEIGVDIEKCGEINVNELIHYFHEEEVEYISASTNPSTAFYSIWTRKEAVLKADGIGIVHGLNKFSTLSDTVLFNGNKFRLHTLYVNPNYASTLAIANTCELVPTIRFKDKIDFDKNKVQLVR